MSNVESNPPLLTVARDAVRSLGRTRDPEGLAADVASKLALALSEKRIHLANPGALASYARTLARNLHIDAIRESSRIQRAERESAHLREQHQTTDQGVGDELQSALDRAVASLTQDQRRAIRLRFVDESGLDAIARALGVSVPTAHRRVQDAVAALRAALRAQARTNPTVARLFDDRGRAS